MPFIMAAPFRKASSQMERVGVIPSQYAATQWFMIDSATSIKFNYISRVRSHTVFLLDTVVFLFDTVARCKEC